MKLKSKDRIFIDASVRTGWLKIQLLQTLEGQTGDEAYGWSSGDVIMLDGPAVAVLLDTLSEAHGHASLDGEGLIPNDPRPGTVGPTRLCVNVNVSIDKTTLAGHTQTIAMTMPEARMFAAAIKSILWRLFV